MKKPKVPAPQPVIERQAYKSPVPREALGSAAGDAVRRRALMGVATSPLGVVEPASTTRNALGGDQQLLPEIGGTPAITAVPPGVIGTAVSNGPTSGAQMGTPRTRSASGGPRPSDAWVGSMLRRRPAVA